MGFGSGKYAKVWKMEDKGNYHVAEISTSKKNKETGQYETDWNNKFVRLVGKAHNQAKNMADGASAKICSCEVTNRYDKEKSVTYTNYVIFEFEDANVENNSNKVTTDGDGFMNTPSGIDEELPFN